MSPVKCGIRQRRDAGEPAGRNCPDSVFVHFVYV